MYELKKINYSHDAMIDLLVANPAINQGAVAEYFGYTQGWVSQVINSDAFRERLAERKDALVDPVIRMTIEERIRALADKSLNVLLNKLDATQNMNVAVRALDVATRALGYGAKAPTVAVQNFVAVVPPRAQSAAEWSKEISDASHS